MGHDTSQYRFDYYPPYGNPSPNTTIIPRELGNEIKFSNGLPGTRYNFRLHPLNDSFRDYLSWEVSLVTRKSFEYLKKKKMNSIYMNLSISSRPPFKLICISTKWQNCVNFLESTYSRQLYIFPIKGEWIFFSFVIFLQFIFRIWRR